MSDRSFEELFREQYPSVLRDAMFILGDREQAKEVTSEAFTRMFARWARVSRYDKPGAWVRRVAIRLAERRQTQASRHTAPGEKAATGPDAHQSDARHDVRDAVRRLAPQQRAAVMLHYFDDLPLADVARVLGCREGTVKAHLHQARGRLESMLDGYGRV